MSRPSSLPSFVPPLVLLLLLLASASSPAATGADDDRIHAAGVRAAEVGCSRGAAAASRVVAESCTEDIVRSFFGVRGRDVCCRALEAAGARCYRAVFSGSPFADVYPTILGNVCGGLAAAPAPGPGENYNST